MPTYQYKCPKCHKEFDIFLSLKDKLEALVECEECLIELQSYCRTAPAVTIPWSHQAAPNMEKKEDLRIPINIIDEKPDGGYRVTRVGTKTDVDNE